MINDEIPFDEVRLINVGGKSEGVVSRQRALEIAEDQGLDLIVVSPDATPPVCKVMDYGQYRCD